MFKLSPSAPSGIVSFPDGRDMVDRGERSMLSVLCEPILLLIYLRSVEFSCKLQNNLDSTAPSLVEADTVVFLNGVLIHSKHV